MYLVSLFEPVSPTRKETVLAYQVCKNAEGEIKNLHIIQRIVR